MNKIDYKFLDRMGNALLNACRFCKHCKDYELAYYAGKIKNTDGYPECDLSLDVRVNLVVRKREKCKHFSDERYIERDTTYPGSTHAPSDNSDINLKEDSTIEDFNPDAPKRCLNQESENSFSEPENNWEDCLKLLFDRRRCNWDRKDKEGKPKPLTFEEILPSPQEVMRLLNSSSIPQFTFRLGLPPERGMGFDRGLWFYRSEKFNSQITITDDMKPEARKVAKKNAETKAEMKKIIMVYLYHCWFKKLENEKKIGYFIALDSSANYSLGKDLSWWMLKVFKDEAALTVYPSEDDTAELEFIPMSLLDKAQQAALLAQADLNSNTELDIEAQEYDEMITRLGYGIDEGIYTDKNGHEMSDSWNTLKPIY